MYKFFWDNPRNTLNMHLTKVSKTNILCTLHFFSAMYLYKSEQESDKHVYN